MTSADAVVTGGEIIHAGIYYPKNSAKAALRGRDRDGFYHYRAERHVPPKGAGQPVCASSSAMADEERCRYAA